MKRLPKGRRSSVAEVVVEDRADGDRVWQFRGIKWPGTRRPIVCTECGKRLVSSVDQARGFGWCMWLGGAVCPDHEFVAIPERKH